MNFQTAGIGALVGFMLSFLVALLAGIPFLDLLLRASLWAVVFGAGAVGAEMLLRSQLPDLFGPAPEPEAEGSAESLGESVNIVLDEDPVRSFVQEVQEQGEDLETPVAAAAVAPAASPAEPQPPPVAPVGDEPMEEIGSFLNSFRPPVEGEDVSAEPAGSDTAASGGSDIGDYLPQEASASESTTLYAPSRGADLEGMEQDPVILAKAVKSVMNKT
jgi:hypothetical protein